MKSKFTIIYLLIAVFFISCSQDNSKIVEEHDDGSPKVIHYFDENSSDQKKIKEDVYVVNRWCVTADGTPFPIQYI